MPAALALDATRAASARSPRRARGFRVLASPASRRVRAAALAPAAAAPLRAPPPRRVRRLGARASPRVPASGRRARRRPRARPRRPHAAVDDALRESYLDVASRPSRFEETSHGLPDVRGVAPGHARSGRTGTPPRAGSPGSPTGSTSTPPGCGRGGGPHPRPPPRGLPPRPVHGRRHEPRRRPSRGREAFGVDVSPLAAFVAAHRTWRPDEGRATLEAMRAAAREVVEGTPEAAANVLAEEEARRRDRPPRADEEKPASSEKKPEAASAPLSSTSSVPRDWRPAQRACAAHLASGALDGAEAGVAGALWFCLSALQRAEDPREKRRRTRSNARRRRSAPRGDRRRASPRSTRRARSRRSWTNTATGWRRSWRRRPRGRRRRRRSTRTFASPASAGRRGAHVAAVPRGVITSPSRGRLRGERRGDRADVAAGKASRGGTRRTSPRRGGGTRGSPRRRRRGGRRGGEGGRRPRAPPRPVPADSRWVDGPEPPYRGTLPRDRDEKAGGERAETRAREIKNVVVPGSEGYFARRCSRPELARGLDPGETGAASAGRTHARRGGLGGGADGLARGGVAEFEGRRAGGHHGRGRR